MVNLRKVGAIATGALFVGATLGMAAAVTVPSDFKASMLADKGVAKAQLVVGKDAPGKTADEASANIIQDAAKTELTYTVPGGAGGDITITYGSKKWDDSSTDSNFTLSDNTTDKTPITTQTNVDGTLLQVTKGDYGYLRIDKNADGDFKDTGDYDFYSEAYMIDGTGGTVQFVYNFSTNVDKTFSVNSAPSSGSVQWFRAGNTFKVKGTRYTITSIESDSEVKLGPTLRATLSSVAQDFAANAVPMDGTRKFAWQGNSSGSTGTLYFIDGAQIQQEYAVTFEKKDRITDSEVTADSFKDYKIYINASYPGNTVYVWAVRKSDEITITDGQSDIMGYDLAWVDHDGSNPTFKEQGLWFADSTISLTLDGSVDVPGTEYYIKWETDKTMKLRRKKTLSVTSGTKLDKDSADYNPLLKEDITPTATDGNITITYGSKNWNDGDNNGEWQNPSGNNLGTDITITDINGEIIQVTNLSKPGGCGFLCIDKNADGDFKDTGDYNIYDGLWIVDGSAGTVQPLYNFSTDYQSNWSLQTDGSTQHYQVGNTFKVKGKKYTISTEEGAEEIKIGPTIAKTLPSTDPTTESTTVSGTLKIAYRNDTTASRTLYFLDGTDILGTYQTTGGTRASISESNLPSGAFRDYRVWYSSQEGNTQLKVWMVKKADEISVIDEQKDVLGYYQVRVNDSTFTGGHGLYFLDNTISLTLDGSVDVPGTEYYIKWTSAKKLQLRRKKTLSVTSGTKLDKDSADYNPFLKEDITPKLTGAGETKAPTLEIVDEDTARSTMNHILIGGPVANKHVSNLVTVGKSTVSWETSDGDIEVVSGHPAEGFNGIIVAGKTRTETKAAAEALAAAL